MGALGLTAVKSQQLFLPRSAGTATTQRSQSWRVSQEGDQGARLGPFCPTGAGLHLLFLVACSHKKPSWGGASGAQQPTTFPDAVHVLLAGSPLPQQPRQGGGRAWRAGRGRPRCSRALAASEAIGSAQSPHAGLQRRPPRIGARAGVRVPPGPYRSPSVSGLRPLLTLPGPAPSIVPCIADAASGAAASRTPRSGARPGSEKGRERRAPCSGARTAPSAHCSSCSPGSAPRPAPLICTSHDPGQSVSASREADGFCLGGKGVAGGACAVAAD